MQITNVNITDFEKHLREAEREGATIAQYMRTVSRLAAWLGGRDATKERMLEYKDMLKKQYKPRSVNAAIAAVNSFFRAFGRHELCLTSLRLQKRMLADKERELDRAEYDRLINAARQRGNTRLLHIVETLFRTGIRISELKYITVEAVSRGRADISCKGKYRPVIIADMLCKRLKRYARENNISAGCIFVTKGGKPVDRSNIWRELKRLAEEAAVAKTKVFAHSFRHLFARVYYSRYKDITRLADILGHSSINTTRIYTMESGAEHRRQLNELCRI